jgi:hypothetical protein
MPLGPNPNYLAKYNDYVLPGYVQEESFDSEMNIAAHYGDYADGSLSEYTGLQNKMLSLRLKVWEPTFGAAKEEIELAATYLRSKRNSFAPLYVQYSDRHYDAMVRSIKVQNTAGRPVRLMEYDVQFECKPWLISDTPVTLSGTGTISTDQVSRTVDNGGWTFANITVTGTDVTISGYTETGDFTGFISIDGAVTNMEIDSENYTAEISAVNRNDLMLTADYRMLVGPGKTNFAITGASSCSITYYDRWYI